MRKTKGSANTMEEKKKYVDEVDSRFQQLSDRIDRIRAAFESLGEETRLKCEIEVENLFKKREVARQTIHDLALAKDNWEFLGRRSKQPSRN